MDSEYEVEQEIEITKEDFMQKAKEMLNAVYNAYCSAIKKKFEDEDDSENNCCDRCGGMLCIEDGGDVIDCPSCNGTGQNNTMVFDKEQFIEDIEHGIIFGNTPFLSLLNCKIIE